MYYFGCPTVQHPTCNYEVAPPLLGLANADRMSFTKALVASTSSAWPDMTVLMCCRPCATFRWSGTSAASSSAFLARDCSPARWPTACRHSESAGKKEGENYLGA